MGKRKSRREEEIKAEDICFRMQQGVVNLLRQKVNRLEEELNFLRSHENLLFRAWSTPVYPPEHLQRSRTAPKVHSEQVSPQAEQADNGPGQPEGNAAQDGKGKRRKTQKSRPAVIPSPVPSPKASQKRRKTHKSRPVQLQEESESDASGDSQDTSSKSEDEDRSPSPVRETVTTESAARSESSSSEDSSSEDDKGDRGKISEPDSEDESSSESEDNDPSPARVPSGSQPHFYRVNWANEPRKRWASGASSSSDSDLNDSDDSVSVVEVADEEVDNQSKAHKVKLQTNPAKDSAKNESFPSEKRKKCHSKLTSGSADKSGQENTKKKEKSSARSAEASNAANDTKGVGDGSARSSSSEDDKLSPDAPPVDIFDWNVLGLPGPWAHANSSSSYSESCQWPKQLTSLPCRFSTYDEYITRNQYLIFEECKAYLDSSWEILQKRDGSVQDSSSGLDGFEDNLEWRTFHLRPMHRCADDSFNFFEMEESGGRRAQIDTSEVLLLSFPKFPAMKVLAIVSNLGDKSVLLKTRVDLQSYGRKCKLARMSNMVTLKRQFVSLFTMTKMCTSLRQQLLDPLLNNGCTLSPPKDDCLDENVQLPSSLNNTLMTWKEHGIFNNRQLLVMAALLQMNQGVLLVQGPPGTGKTSTIVGMLSAVCIEEPGSKILVCGASNAAVDEIVSRLMHTMLDKDGKLYSPKLGTLIRVGVQKAVQVACHPVMMDTLLSRSSKASRATARTELLSGASIVCSTLSGSGHPVFEETNQKFDVIVLDEAAQALECETLIALQRAKGRLVIVGDPCQLPATVIQRPGTAYGRSLFERMQQGGMQTFLMTTQYRMHPQISKYPSATFYRGCLKDSKSTQCMSTIFKQDACTSGISCDGYRFRLGPYCFLDVSWGEEELEATGHSLWNAEEAAVVATVVHGVVKSLKNGRKADIGVITPYLAQRSTILSSLLKYKIGEDVCEVNTVDGFQGREKEIIVLSCVRAATEKGLGFVSDERRMNVALTRAKHSLIIVGHGETLKSQSKSWCALLEDATSRGCYQVLRSRGATRNSRKSPPVEQTVPGVSEKAAKFHSAQTSPVEKAQSVAKKTISVPPAAAVKVEPVTCDFAHHFPGCSHNHHEGGQVYGQVPSPMDTVKRMRGAVRINLPAQNRGGGNSGRGRSSSTYGGFPRNVGVARANQHIYFAHPTGENQQVFQAQTPGFDAGRSFLGAQMHFSSHPGRGRGMNHGGHWHAPQGIVNQGPPFRSPHANQGRR